MSSTLLPRVAYFCMEFAVSDALPLYAGGLGVVSGDFLKAAGDLHLPVVGVGIFWAEGYAVQRVGESGAMWDEFPQTSRAGLTPTNVQVGVPLRGREVPITAYRVDQPGLAPLYLLEPVLESDRWITRRLYGGGSEERLSQEVILGIGGLRILRALGVDADVFHFSEQHPVLGGLELIRQRMAGGATFAAAWQATREQVVYTTHTPGSFGSETHRLELMHDVGADLGLSADELTALGGDPFSMALAGLRLASIASGVSELHAENLRTSLDGVDGVPPIVAVTNGVHPWTWQDARMRSAYSSGSLRQAHQGLKRELIATIRGRTGILLDENRLLVGVARRAAPYKRADLVVSDLERIAPLLRARRVQIVFGGKAHPYDDVGKRILAALVGAARAFPESVVFLENYDTRIAPLLVRGCDVWLNTPRRPMEACGLSGMKAAMNGVLHVSVLDGWWPEACAHGQNGWQLGDAYEGTGQDEHDRAALIDLLEKEVLPAYEGATPRWEAMMRASIEMAQWRYSSYRMIEDYYAKVYRKVSAPISAASPGAVGLAAGGT